MTNFEKYKVQLFKLATQYDTLAALFEGEVYPCTKMTCEKCQFYRLDKSCSTMFLKWLFEEYEEKPKLSERAYHFLKSLPEGARIKYSRGFLYVADRTGSLYCADNFFLQKLSQLVEAIWYEVSELLEWEVE